ncbi:MAG: DUF1499 domain-containing protein [Planctomycetes bacterium]|nr:DUF1499 domain-containing protein [Planctomycetota bacterium]
MSTAQTDFNSTNPTLRPPKFQRRRPAMYEAICLLIEDQDHYKITSKDETNARLKCEIQCGMGVVHDAEIWVEGDINGPVSVHMRSSKKSGLLDLGAANRNISEFTKLLHHRES